MSTSNKYTLNHVIPITIITPKIPTKNNFKSLFIEKSSKLNIFKRILFNNKNGLLKIIRILFDQLTKF